jgi:CheY-like chemotaxis protein
MSYEIRTPLNGIIGMTDILTKQDVSVEVQEFVGLLRRSTEVLLNIINDILDFSKIETGKMILDEIPFNLREEIGYCTDLVNARIADKDVKFKCTVDDRIPESIISDPFRLRQILTNNLLNSAANTGSGEIRLNCTLVNNDKGVITLGFELLDTGLSFDKATLKKIYGDFVNIESKVMKNRDESGFGTILARQLVELMGGTLTAECPSGLSGELGTKVTFTIRAYSNDRVIKNLDHSKIVRFDQIKTLVITGPLRDEEVLGQLHRMGLNISLTSFQRSTSGQIKASLSDPEGRYNLIIITDDSEFNGFDAAQTLFENDLSERLIIILLSSNDIQGNYLKCITMGIDHYFVKPFDDSDLKNAIKYSFPYTESEAETADISNVRSELRILVVEDNRMSQKVLATMLKTLGYSCDLANDGLEGFKMAKGNKYDLIFMDLVMPEMNGYDSARKILTIHKNVLIVAFTADNMPDAKSKAELSGIREFITKPVRIDELKRLLAQHFRKG